MQRLLKMSSEKPSNRIEAIIPGYELETKLSLDQMKLIVHESYSRKICNTSKPKNMIGFLGGWATHFYVDTNFQRMHGKHYLGSLDMDIFYIVKRTVLNNLSRWLLKLVASPQLYIDTIGSLKEITRIIIP